MSWISTPSKSKNLLPHNGKKFLSNSSFKTNRGRMKRRKNIFERTNLNFFSKFSFDKTCLVFFCHSRKMCSFFFLFLSPWKYLRKMCDHHHVSLDSLEWSMEWRAPSSLTFFFFSLGCWGESFDPDYEKPFPLLFRSNVKYYWSITFLLLSVTRFMTDWRVRCRKNNNNSELKQPE